MAGEMMQSVVTGSGVLEQMAEARTTCRELLALLMAENSGLMKQKVEEVEERLQQKRRLTLRLEMTMKTLKERRQEWVGRADVQTVALRLAEEVRLFQDQAKKNLELLKAAHKLRADMVNIIRDTLDAQAPRVQTYGRNGYMAAAHTGSRMLAREV